MHYIFALLIMLSIFFLILLFAKRMDRVNIVNFIFTVCIFVPYLIRIIMIGYDVGWTDWNFLNTLPTANVSPFMFFMVPFLLVMPEKIKKRIYLLVAMTCVGMFAACVLDCIRLTMVHYRLNWLFICDQFCHMALAAWGVYLVKSNQVNVGFCSCLKSGSILVGVALFMLGVNIIFETSFFGLSLKGKHNIYLMVLVDNSYLSAPIYFAGLISVLAMGYGVLRMLKGKALPENTSIS